MCMYMYIQIYIYIYIYLIVYYVKKQLHTTTLLGACPPEKCVHQYHHPHFEA